MPLSRVGPTEEVVEAFIDSLVEPLLLMFGVSANQPPPPDVQSVIANRMHAVALLYNYYHRRQLLSLKFLDVVSFCKLAMKCRPALTSCMKIAKRSNPKELIGEEDQFSLTEKSVNDACNLAVSLDPAEDALMVEGFAISKVAVLLMDSENISCFLQYGEYGVWSLIEKDVTDLTGSQVLASQKAGCKRKRDDHEESNEDKELLKVARDAVKDATGIESLDLVVMQSWITHSLTKEKSAVKFYIMQCSQPFAKSNAVRLSELVASLQGPLAEPFLDNWTVTAVVEHFPILPYATFISDWLWGKVESLGSGKKLKPPNAENTASPVNAFQNTEKSAEVREECKQKPNFLDLTESEASRSSSDRMLMSEASAKDDNEKLESCGKVYDMGFAANEASRDNLEKSNNDVAADKTHLNSREHSPKTPMFGNIFPNLEENGKEAEIPGNGSSQNVVMPSLGFSREQIRGNQLESTNNGLERENNTGKTQSFEHHRGHDVASVEHDDANGPEASVESQAETPDNVKLDDSPSVCNKETEQCAGLSILYGDNRAPGITNGLVQFETAKNNTVGQNKLASDDINNDALALLNRRRMDLYSQFYSIEDKLTTYEDYIERIRDDGDADLACQCITSILSGKSGLLNENDSSEDGKNATTEPPKPFFLEKSSCSDLEYICLRNNWKFPRYFVETSDGKFKSQVFLTTTDIVNLRTEGGLESNPYEARESAAAQMIANIQKTFA